MPHHRSHPRLLSSHFINNAGCYRTLALIKPDALAHIARIFDDVWQSGFQVVKLRTMRLNRPQVIDLYREVQSKSYFKWAIAWCLQYRPTLLRPLLCVLCARLGYTSTPPTWMSEWMNEWMNLYLPWTATQKTRKPCCRRETARCRCNFWSIPSLLALCWSNISQSNAVSQWMHRVRVNTVCLKKQKNLYY